MEVTIHMRLNLAERALNSQISGRRRGPLRLKWLRRRLLGLFRLESWRTFPARRFNRRRRRAVTRMTIELKRKRVQVHVTKLLRTKSMSRSVIVKRQGDFEAGSNDSHKMGK